MKFLCDQCQAQYMIADEKVGPKGVKVRCKKCGHIISVSKDDAAAQGASPQTQAPAANAQGSAFDDIFGNAGAGAGGDDARAPTKVFTTSELDKVRQEQSLAKQATGPSEDEPPTQQMSIAPAAKAEWYLAIHDEQVGPITVEDVRRVSPGTTGWWNRHSA